MSTYYYVYSNSGVGDAIDYTTSVAIVTGGTSWTTSALHASGDYWFGVRAFDSITGLQEANIDCAVEVVLDSKGNDITNRPFPPLGLRGFATAGGGIKVEWFHGRSNRLRIPVGFNVYIGAGVSPDYGSPAVVVAYGSAIMGTFYANLSGLADGVSYSIGVRAFNQAAEEGNTTTVTVVAKVTGPMPVVALTATAIV